jgi:hypothetical protein
MTDNLQPQFVEVLTLIQVAQSLVIATINPQLAQLYQSISGVAETFRFR